MKTECGIRYSEAVITGDEVTLERLTYDNFGMEISVGIVSSTAAVTLDCSNCPFSDVLERTVTGVSPALQAIEAAESEAEQIVEAIKRNCNP